MLRQFPGLGQAAPWSMDPQQRARYFGLSDYLWAVPQFANDRDSLRQALNNLGSSVTRGGTILLGEGVWTFYEEFEIDVPNIALVALAPQKTIFRRQENTSGPMMTMSGDGWRLHGIRIQDESTDTGGGTYSFVLSGDRGAMSDCYFEKCPRAAVVTGDWCKVSDSHVESWNNGANCFAALGSYPQFNCVGIEGAATTASIFAFDASVNGIYTNINSGAATALSYLGASGSTHAAVLPAVTVR